MTLIQDIHSFLVFHFVLFHMYVASYLDFAAENLERGFFLQCDLTLLPQSCMLGWDKNRYSRITDLNLRSHLLHVSADQYFTGSVRRHRKKKKNDYLKPLTSKTEEIEKQVLVSQEKNPYQEIGLGLVKAKLIFLYARSTIHTDSRRLILHIGYFENGWHTSNES